MSFEVLGAEYLLNFGAMGIFAIYLMVKDKQHTDFMKNFANVIAANTAALARVNDELVRTEQLEKIIKEEVTDLKTLRNIQERLKNE